MSTRKKTPATLADGTTLKARLRLARKGNPKTEYNEPLEQGRVVATWRYDKDGQQFEIPVKIIEEHRYRSGSTKRRPEDDTGHLHSVEFGVFIEQPVSIAIVSTDIEALRVAVFEELEEGTRIEWEPYYYITITQPDIYGGGGGEGVVFEYEYMYLGALADGAEVYRTDAYYETRIHKGRPPTGSDLNGHRMRTLVPLDKHTEKAITSFCRELARVRERIAKRFAPKTAMQTLAQLSTLKLLPAPKTTRYQPEPSPMVRAATRKKRKTPKKRKKSKRV